MSSQVQAYRQVAVAIDHLTALLLQVPNGEVKDSNLRHTSGKLIAANSEDDGVYWPPQAIHMNRDALYALRAALVEHVPDPVGIDRSLKALSQLMDDGFSLLVSIPVNDEPHQTSEKLTRAMKMLNEAGFNIQVNPDPNVIGKHEFLAYPIS